MNKKKKILFIDLLRLFAILLITNSHFDGVYPWDISFGGAPGVALFFLITGFLLYDSNFSIPFIQWYGKKLLRLYPAIIVSSFLMILIGYFNIDNVFDLVRLIIYPTHWWYIKNLLIMYIIFYTVRRIKRVSDTHMIIFWTIVYLIVFSLYKKNTFFVDSFYFRLCYGLVAMHAGYLLRKKWEKINLKEFPQIWFVKWGWLSFLSLVGFLSVKLLMNRIEGIYYIQFMVHVFSVCFAISFCKFLMSFENILEKNKNKIVIRMAGYISGASLEIYFIQHPIINCLKSLFFPINFIFIIVAIIFCGLFVHYISNIIYRRLLIIFKIR